MKRKSAHLFVVAVLALLGSMAQKGRGDFVLYDNEQFLVNFYHNQGTLYDTSRAFIVTGGSVDECIWAYDSSAVDVSGGSVYILNAYDFSTANISGGGVSYLYAYNSSTVIFHGQNFSASGGLHFDGNRVLGTGILSGKWMDGTPWEMSVVQNDPTATILAVPESPTPKYSGGTGEPNDPYRIAKAEDLNDIGRYEEDWDKHFVLVNDVNLAGYTGTQFNIIGIDPYLGTPFTGVFDGNDHKVWNFTWSSTGRNDIGLFGNLGSGGQIKNLGMENVDVNAVNGWHAGGLVGTNNGTIRDCYAVATVDGEGCVGGLVGANDTGTITNCYSTGSISGDDYVGGLVGENCGTITDCYSTCDVSGIYQVSGLVGSNWGTITDCYSTGSVTGSGGVGGLVGFNGDGTITNCYSTGSVSGISYVGGLVGGNQGGTTMASFWDTQTSGQSTSAGGEPKTTAEMKTMRTFTNAGWDFVEIWGIGENQTYPFLRTEPAGDSNYDKKVDLVDLAILASHWLEGP